MDPNSTAGGRKKKKDLIGNQDENALAQISAMNLQVAGGDDDDDADNFSSGGASRSSNFVKAGVKKDHATGEIVGWKEFYEQVVSSNAIPHNSQVDEQTIEQINKAYQKNTMPSYIVEPS